METLSDHQQELANAAIDFAMNNPETVDQFLDFIHDKYPELFQRILAKRLLKDAQEVIN